MSVKVQDNNKDLIQSYIFTVAKYDFSVYEKRILYRQIEIEQALLENIPIGKGIKIDTSLWGNKRYTIPIALLLKDEDDKNYYQIKKAFESLLKKTIRYEDKRVVEGFGVIQEYKIEKRSSFVSWVSHPKIVEATMNFSKGFRKYELLTAMQFESIYAMRIYELMSGQKTKIEYSIDKLKEMFNIEGKYKQVNDFIKKVIIAAKNELDQKSPYTFDFLPQKHGRKITSILFIPIFQPDKRDPELEKKSLQRQVSPSWDLTKNTIDYLKYSFDFTLKEIKQNIDLLAEAQNKMDLIQFMANIKPRANRANNPKGYLINALKIELKINE